MKCVVPIITAFTAAGSNARWRFSSSRAVVMPLVTSRVVAVFTAARTVVPSMSTASVLVPPTSIPIRIDKGPSVRR